MGDRRQRRSIDAERGPERLLAGVDVAPHVMAAPELRHPRCDQLGEQPEEFAAAVAQGREIAGPTAG
jgi:hypothetical protein